MTRQLHLRRRLLAGRPARAYWRGERGAVGSVQLVVVLPLLMGLFMAAMQAAMFYYGRTAAISIAQTGATAAAAEHGTIADCEQAAASLRASIGDALTEVQISCQRTATRARVTVSGQALSVFPGWRSTVVQQAEAPVERPT
jgi:Flp pilus assembly protein TadG